jgi:O-antigen/teichoic acid export membrane protein
LQSVFTAEGRPGLEARVNTVGSLVCLAGYALLIPKFRLWGAIIATLIGFGVILVYGFWEAQRVRRFRFEYGRLLRIALFAVITVGVFQAVRPADLWLQAALACLFSGAYAAALWTVCFDADERTAVMEALAGLRKKVFSRNRVQEVAA